MRTVIFIGLVAIADAINKDWHGHEYIGFYTTVLICAIAFDILDFGSKIARRIRGK